MVLYLYKKKRELELSLWQTAEKAVTCKINLLLQNVYLSLLILPEEQRFSLFNLNFFILKAFLNKLKTLDDPKMISIIIFISLSFMKRTSFFLGVRESPLPFFANAKLDYIIFFLASKKNFTCI